MWLLKWASQDIGNFHTVEGAHQYLSDKYGNENVTNQGEFTPMISYRSGKKWMKKPHSQRGRCIAFEVKESKNGWDSTTRFELEKIEVLDS